MPEETTQTTQTDTTQQTEPTLIAGKFKDEAAFHEGFQQLAQHEKVGMAALANAQFESVEQKVEAYKQMESALGRSTPPAPAPDKLEVGGDRPAPPQPMTMNELVAGLGIEQEKLNSAVMGGGGIPDEVYQQFGKAVIKMPDGTERPLGKELVDQVLGAQAQGAQYQQMLAQQAANHVGGTDKLNALLQFGGTLDPVTQKSINMELNNPATMQAALDRLDGLYAKSVGAGNSNGIVSNTQGTTTPLANTPFKTVQEEREFKKQHGADSEVYKSRLLKTPDDVFNRIA